MVTAQGMAIFALFLWLAVDRIARYLDESRGSLTVESRGEDLYVNTTSDRPFVVTHLTSTGYSDSDKRVAPLPRAMACVDSAGLIIPKVADLDWRNTRGEADTPPPSSSIRILFLRPEVLGAEPR